MSKLLLKIDDDVFGRFTTLRKLAVNMKEWMNSTIPVYAGKSLLEPYSPHRVKTHPYYVSRDAWQYKHYPLWLQGMVFFLKPKYTAELFEAALRTNYIFMDDVFIGICVNKTARAGQKTLNLRDLSTYRVGKNRERDLSSDWKGEKVTFFHLPDGENFLKFFYNENAHFGWS